MADTLWCPIATRIPRSRGRNTSYGGCGTKSRKEAVYDATQTGEFSVQIRDLKQSSDPRIPQQDRLLSPIEIRVADVGEGPDGITPAKYWMRARNIPTFEASFQKVIQSPTTLCRFTYSLQLNVQCILAYLSDLMLCACLPSVFKFRTNNSTCSLNTVSRSVRGNPDNEGNTAITMMVCCLTRLRRL